MRILYGVVGEGFGHATRSKVILEHLSKEHDVLIVGSGKAYDYLGRTYSNIKRIEGFELAIDQEGVRKRRTVGRFIKSLPKKATRNAMAFAKVSRGFSPDVVISDFESFAHVLGRTHRKPIISIDNMQILNRCKMDIEIPLDTFDDYILAKAIIKNKLPMCHHYMITTFFYPSVAKKNTSLFPPILRNEVLEAKVTQGDHILVYHTSGSDWDLMDLIKKFDSKFIVYGFSGKKRSGKKIKFRDFSEEGFIKDLASSKAVIGSGGFSLISESVYLGKPYMAIPLENQFEQFLNALYIRKLRYGEYVRKPGKKDIEFFLDNLDFYRKNLKRHRQDGNKLILKDLDGLLNSIRKGSK
jgi:uncharacterized protein (TIGR00661 family)